MPIFHDSSHTPLFDVPITHGKIDILGSPFGGVPLPGVWVRDDRYFPGASTEQARWAIPTTNAVVQVSNWANGLINFYGQLSAIATADITGVLDFLVLPAGGAIRRPWGGRAAAGTKLAVVNNHYDTPQSSNPARLYDLSDPTNITLITNKSVGPYGIGSGSGFSSCCLDPNNVLWFTHLSGSTYRIVGSDFDTANVTDHGPFNLSHQVFGLGMVDHVFVNAGTYYGAIAGRQTLSVFSTAGIVGTASLGTGATSIPFDCWRATDSLLLVHVLDSTGSVMRLKGINVSTPSSPTVAWTWTPGHQIEFVGCPDAATAIFTNLDNGDWDWFDLATQTVTHTLAPDASGFASGGVLLTDGSIAALANDLGEGDGIIFIPRPREQPSPNQAAGPRPWRTPVTEPSTGLGAAIVKWDSRLLTSVTAGATFPNTGSAGSVFDLKIVDDGPGDVIYAKKQVNWAGGADFGPNATLPSESDMGGDWSAGPATFIFALPAGHRTFENTIGYIEVDIIPGDGGAYDFVTPSAEGFAFDGGFSGLYGASLGDSIGEGTFFEAYWDETITNPLMDRDIDLLVALYIDPASRSYGVWVVDSGGVNTVAHDDNAYPEGPNVDEYFFENGTWPCPQFDSQGTTASDLFLFFAGTAHDTAVAGNPWDGCVWAGLYRGRPSNSELLALYASSF
jgi:hypothetical protein